MSLHDYADCSSIATLAITVLTGGVGIYGYVSYRIDRSRKSKRLEAYLRQEKDTGEDQGKRTLLRIVRDIGLTEDEIIQASFRNARIGRFIKPDADSGLAKELMFGYKA